MLKLLPNISILLEQMHFFFQNKHYSRAKYGMLSNKPKNNWYIQITKINTILQKKKKKKNYFWFWILEIKCYPKVNWQMTKIKTTNDTFWMLVIQNLSLNSTQSLRKMGYAFNSSAELKLSGSVTSFYKIIEP